MTVMRWQLESTLSLVTTHCYGHRSVWLIRVASLACTGKAVIAGPSVAPLALQCC